MNQRSQSASCCDLNSAISAGSWSLPTPIVPRLLRISAVAFYLSSTTWYVETLLRNHQIPYLVLGRRKVVDVQDLNLWIEEQKRIARARDENCSVQATRLRKQHENAFPADEIKRRIH
jgi:hypothetical protein